MYICIKSDGSFQYSKQFSGTEETKLVLLPHQCIIVQSVLTLENPVKPPWRWLGGWLQPKTYSVLSNVNFALEMRPATLPTELPR